MFITCHVAQESSSDIWFLDSGCSNHMIRNRDIFESLDTSIKSKLKLGNDNIMEVSGKGTIVVMTNLGKKSIPNVYFLHSLKCNLISVGQLTQKDYKVIFENNICTIFDISPNIMVTARLEMIDNRMFPLHMKSGVMDEDGVSFKTTCQDQSWI